MLKPKPRIRKVGPNSRPSSFAKIDYRTAAGRRLLEIEAALVKQAGGPDALNSMAALILRSCALKMLRLELLGAAVMQGDLALESDRRLQWLSGAVLRDLQALRIDLRKPATDVPWDQWLARHGAAERRLREVAAEGDPVVAEPARRAAFTQAVAKSERREFGALDDLWSALGGPPPDGTPLSPPARPRPTDRRSPGAEDDNDDAENSTVDRTVEGHPPGGRFTGRDRPGVGSGRAPAGEKSARSYPAGFSKNSDAAVNPRSRKPH